MDILFIVGRVLFGGFFVISGWSHFNNLKSMVGYAQYKKIPMAKLAVIFTGLLLLFGGLGVVFGVLVPYALLALAIFLVPTTLLMHKFWEVTDPTQKMTETIQFKKNLALLGAVLMLFTLATPWMMSFF